MLADLSVHLLKPRLYGNTFNSIAFKLEINKYVHTYSIGT